jgi:tetratricopeptide (TPR) repeat protein
MTGTKAPRRLLKVLPLAVAALLAFSGPAEAQKKTPKNSEKDPQYQYEKGVIAFRYGLTDEAIRYGELAVGLDPGHYGGWTLLGSAHFRKGEVAEAVVAFEKAAALRPDLSDAHANLGQAYLEANELDKAEAELTKACHNDGNAAAAFNLSKLHLKQKKLEQALDDVGNSIRKDGRNAGAYNLKGVVLNELGRYAEAAGSFKAGLVLSPEDINLQINLGIAYINSGQPDKAGPVLEKVIPKIEDPVLKSRVEGYLKTIKERGGPTEDP